MTVKMKVALAVHLMNDQIPGFCSVAITSKLLQL